MTYFDAAVGADLQTALDVMFEDWADVTSTTMFGCPSYRAADTLFAVLVTDGVVLTRLPQELREEVEGAFHAGPFRAGERTINKWLQVPIASDTDLDSLRPYIEASYAAALLDR